LPQAGSKTERRVRIQDLVEHIAFSQDRLERTIDGTHPLAVELAELGLIAGTRVSLWKVQWHLYARSMSPRIGECFSVLLPPIDRLIR
jgi:hypothetical protein